MLGPTFPRGAISRLAHPEFIVPLLELSLVPLHELHCPDSRRQRRHFLVTLGSSDALHLAVLQLPVTGIVADYLIDLVVPLALFAAKLLQNSKEGSEDVSLTSI